MTDGKLDRNVQFYIMMRETLGLQCVIVIFWQQPPQEANVEAAIIKASEVVASLTLFKGKAYSGGCSASKERREKKERRRPLYRVGFDHMELVCAGIGNIQTLSHCYDTLCASIHVWYISGLSSVMLKHTHSVETKQDTVCVRERG